MSTILSQLNTEQRDAARTIDGPVLVLAGAGTGKTRVITYRIAYMISQGINPANILGMTFTNKAAREMRERVAQLVSPGDAEKVTLSTFHSFCAKLLRKEISVLGFTPNFTIAVDSDQKSILKQAIVECGYLSSDVPVDAVSSMVSKAKNNMITPQELADSADREDLIRAAQIYGRYQQILENQNMLDFDDLLLDVVKIWQENPTILEFYQDLYKYVLVDEYQDTNMVQFKLLKLLTEQAKNLCVVGDDDQSIYGWRGAKVEHILDFPQQFPGAKVVKLEQNYRSTNTILKAANTVIAGNTGRYQKNLWSQIGEGEPIQVVTTPSADREAMFVAEAIQNMVSSEAVLSHNDIAVLYRSNHLSRLLEKSFRKESVPYRVVGSRSFYQRKEILDAVAHLKLVANPRDDQSLLRIINVPPRGLGDKAIKTLKDVQKKTHFPLLQLLCGDTMRSELSESALASAQHFHKTIEHAQRQFREPGNLAQKAEQLFLDIGYLNGFQKIYKRLDEAQDRQDNVNEFLNAMAQFEQNVTGKPTLAEFIESFSLLDDNDKVDEDEQHAVTLMTVHAAKGLEFPCVFLVGVEHNIFPNERSVDEGAESEERRLFYVALTRAKQSLIISHAKERMRQRKTHYQRPSDFLKAFTDEHVNRTNEEEFFDDVSEDAFDDVFADIFKIVGNDE